MTIRLQTSSPFHGSGFQSEELVMQKAGHQARGYVYTRNRRPEPRLLTYATMNFIDGLQSV